MIEIELIEVGGFKGAIRGMRHPYESYEKSDSCEELLEPACTLDDWANCELAKGAGKFLIGPNDMELCKKLIKAGSDHRKFLRMIHVQMDIRAPMYFWKQMDKYQIGVVTNSQSTMHTIHKKWFEPSDFSMEHMLPFDVNMWILNLNSARDKYLETKDKNDWYALIEMLPQSYMQTRTVDINYETLLRIAVSRRGHKLKEWTDFIEWMKKELPYFNEFLDAMGRKNKEISK